MKALQGKSLVSRLDFGDGDVVTVETLRHGSDVDTVGRHRVSIDSICERRGVTPLYPPLLDAARLH